MALTLGLSTIVAGMDPIADAVRASPGAIPDRATFGVVHTQVDADPWHPSSSDARATAVLRSTAVAQDQAIMGWGATNPEPSPGQFDWSSLDRRVALIRSSGAAPIITLCCSPDWMFGGPAGSTDWSRLGTAPTPTHYADFASLAVSIARRYPDARAFIVWNELKGFYSSTTNAWDAAGYTELYNSVYDALKAYDPTIRVGGPYAVIDSWHSSSAGGHPSNVSGPWGIVDKRGLDAISYWLAHKHGADFLALDASSAPHDDSDVTRPLQALDKFTAVMSWVRARSQLPVWWAEAYAGLPSGMKPATSEGTLVYTALAMKLAAAGAARVFFWDAEQYPGSSTPGLYSSTTTAEGGGATAFAKVLAALNRTADGASVTLTTISSPSRSWSLTSSTGAVHLSIPSWLH